jgi:co-chaperonin GroES (HSP10)
MTSSYNQAVNFPIADIRPVADRVLLLRLPDIPRSASALIVPDVASHPSHRGKVERCGPGKFDLQRGSRKPLSVKVGDIVQYQSCDLDDGTHVLIEEADILFIES